jgi:hypothetical protein
MKVGLVGTISAALMVGCIPRLDVPEEARLLCETSADCPGAMDCHLLEGYCVRAYVPDVDGPRVTAAVADSETTVVVFFDEPLDPEGVDDPAHYQVTPDLDVRLASLRADGSSVMLATGWQSPTLPYTVTVSGLRDPSGNGMDPDHDRAVFAGFGAAPSTDAPVLIAPLDDQRILAGDAPTFAWSRPEGALHFTLQIATDPSFETPILEWVGEVTFHALDPEDAGRLTAVDHHWRVRTEHSDWSEPWRLVVEDPDAVYAAPCDSPRTGTSGNRGDPFCIVSDAVVHARATADESAPAREVRLSAGTFTEIVNVLPGVTLRGSYDPASWSPVAGPPSTLIRAPEGATTAVNAVGAHGARLERLEVVNENDIAAAYAVFVFGSHDFVVDDCVLRGGHHFDPVGLRIWSSDRVLVRASRLYGGGSGAMNPRGLWASSTHDLHLQDSFFVGSETHEGIIQGTYGIELSFAYGFRIEGATVYGGAIGQNAFSAGIRLAYSDGVIDGNTLHGGHPDDREGVPGWTNAINVWVGSPLPDARPEGTLVITNNVIRNGRAEFWASGIGVDPYGVPDCDPTGETDRPTRIYVANNTFILENDPEAGETPRQAGFVRPTSCVQAWNNLIVGLHGIQWTHGFWQQWRPEPSTDSVRPIYGHNLVRLAGDSATLRGQDGSLRNAAEGEIDLDAPWLAPMEEEHCITGPAQNPVNECDPPVREPTFGNRTTFQTAADLFVDPDAGDFRPKAGADVLGTGANLSEMPGFGPGILRDRDGVARPATGPWTIGAYQ